MVEIGRDDDPAPELDGFPIELVAEEAALEDDGAAPDDAFELDA